MNLFIDTNIILEIILGQQHDQEARSLLSMTHRNCAWSSMRRDKAGRV